MPIFLATISKHQVLLISQISKANRGIISNFRMLNHKRNFFLITPAVINPGGVVSQGELRRQLAYRSSKNSASVMDIKQSTVICPVGYPLSASDPGYAKGPQNPPMLAKAKTAAFRVVFFVCPAIFDEIKLSC